MRHESREEIDATHRIDLTTLFENATDWEDELDRLRSDMERDPTPDEIEDPDDVVEVLRQYERVIDRSQALEVYSQLRTCLDAEDDDWQRRRRAYESVAADVTDFRADVQRALGELGAERAVELAERAGRGEYERFLRDAIDATTHRREPVVEGLLNAFEDEFDTEVRVIRAATTRDFDPPTIETPEGDREVTMGELRRLGKHPDREVRRRARSAFLDELGRYEHTIAAAYADKVKKQVRLAEEREYDSARAKAMTSESYPPTGLRNRFPPEAFEATLDALRENLEPYHRYLGRRRDLLGVEQLRPWDRNAPLAATDAPEIPYEEAREHVLDAVEPLGADYRARLAEYLDDRRIDVFPAERKREDIPAMAPATSRHGSFVFANYDRTVRTAFYLAHELGHAMAQSFASERQPIVYATVPQPISEVPSVVHEVLLAEHLLETGSAPMTEHVRDRYFDFATGNLYGAGKWATFTDGCYGTVEDGEELAVEDVRETYREARERFEPTIEPREGEPGWLRGSFIRAPYSNYQYVLGAAGALAVSHRLLDGDLDPETYREALALGGRVPPIEWFDRLGLDARDGGMIATATERVDDLVDRLL